MQDRTEIASQAVSHAGTAVSLSSGLWVWMGQNHDQIAVICAITGAVMAVVGGIVNWAHKRKIRKILMSKKIASKEELLDYFSKRKKNI